jgi:hypothetical protein
MLDGPHKRAAAVRSTIPLSRSHYWHRQFQSIEIALSLDILESVDLVANIPELEHAPDEYNRDGADSKELRLSSPDEATSLGASGLSATGREFGPGKVDADRVGNGPAAEATTADPSRVCSQLKSEHCE